MILNAKADNNKFNQDDSVSEMNKYELDLIYKFISIDINNISGLCNIFDEIVKFNVGKFLNLNKHYNIKRDLITKIIYILSKKCCKNYFLCLELLNNLLSEDTNKYYEYFATFDVESLLNSIILDNNIVKSCKLEFIYKILNFEDYFSTIVNIFTYNYINISHVNNITDLRIIIRIIKQICKKIVDLNIITIYLDFICLLLDNKSLTDYHPIFIECLIIITENTNKIFVRNHKIYCTVLELFAKNQDTLHILNECSYFLYLLSQDSFLDENAFVLIINALNYIEPSDPDVSNFLENVGSILYIHIINNKHLDLFKIGELKLCLNEGSTKAKLNISLAICTLLLKYDDDNFLLYLTQDLLDSIKILIYSTEKQYIDIFVNIIARFSLLLLNRDQVTKLKEIFMKTEILDILMTLIESSDNVVYANLYDILISFR